MPSISCELEPLTVPDRDCHGWKCEFYNCSKNGGDWKPNCMCFCRYGLIVNFLAFFVYLVVFYVCWRLKSALPRLVSTFAVSLAGVFLCLSLLTEACEPAVIGSIVELGFLPCGLAGLWGISQSQEACRYLNLSRRTNSQPERETRAVQQQNLYSRAVDQTQSNVQHILAIGPGGETQLATQIASNGMDYDREK